MFQRPDFAADRLPTARPTAAWLALIGVIALILCGSVVATAEDAAKGLNVVVFLADDLGYSDLGCYGGEIATPNLDKLAATGLRFTNFSNTARCWSSRAAILTGYYPQQVNRDPQGKRPAWAALLPELLKSAGYRSYHSGKWHIDGPVLAGGFDRSYHLEDPDHNFSPTDHRLDDRRLPRPTPADDYDSTRNIAARSVAWLAEHDAEHRSQPFFLYVAFTVPHFPLQAVREDIERYRDRYKSGWDQIRRERWERQRTLGIFDWELSPLDAWTVPNWNPSEQELQRKIGPGEVGHAVPWDSMTPEQKDFQTGKMAIHAAMVDRMDREIGRVIAKLEAIGHRDDTLILFASDNGASAEQLIRGDGHDPAAPPGSAKPSSALVQAGRPRPVPRSGSMNRGFTRGASPHRSSPPGPPGSRRGASSATPRGTSSTSCRPCWTSLRSRHRPPEAASLGPHCRDET